MSDCIFCKIVNKEIPADFVFEDEELIVIKDIQPKAKFHFLIISKKHIASVNELEAGDTDLVGKMIYQGKLAAAENGFAESGYKLIVNCGKDGGQVVPHLHFHLLGGQSLAGLV